MLPLEEVLERFKGPDGEEGSDWLYGVRDVVDEIIVRRKHAPGLPWLLCPGQVLAALLLQARGLSCDNPTEVTLLESLAVTLLLSVKQPGLHRSPCIVHRSS